MGALADALLEITVYSALLFAAIMAFRSALGKYISPQLRYGVWALLIIRLLLPFTFESSVHLITIEQPVQVNTPMQAVIQQPQVEDNASIGMQQDANNRLVDSNPSPLDGRGIVYTDRPVDWRGIVVAIWLAGCGVMLARLAWMRSRAKKKLEQSRLPADNDTRGMVKLCLTEMKIRTLPLYIQRDVASPALTLSLRPQLLLPEGLAGMNPMQAEYAVRHELTHYKCGDHLTSLLLAVLRCVYWFNPIIWVAFRRIEEDMEVACDARVVSSMNTEQKKLYARTIIDLACKDANECYALGMSRDDRNTIEQRIRGVFMNIKTKKKAIIVAIVLLPILAVLCFTTVLRPQTETAHAEQNTGQPIELPTDEPTSTPTASAAQPPEAPAHEGYLPEGFVSEDSNRMSYDRMMEEVQVQLPKADFRGMPVYTYLEEVEGEGGYTDMMYDVYIGGTSKVDALYRVSVRALLPDSENPMQYSDMPNYLAEGFDAPKAGLLDYAGVKAVVEKACANAGYAIEGMPIHTLWDADSFEHDSYLIHVGGTGSIREADYYMYVNAENGEVTTLEKVQQQVLSLDSSDPDWDSADRRKAMDAALAYCEKEYPDKKVVAYYTDALQALFDAEDSMLLDCYVAFDDGTAVCVGIKVPGYTVFRTGDCTNDFMEKGRLSIFPDPWEDNR